MNLPCVPIDMKKAAIRKRVDNVYQQLKSDRKFFAGIAARILEASFPASIHEDVLQAGKPPYPPDNFDYLNNYSVLKD